MQGNKETKIVIQIEAVEEEHSKISPLLTHWFEVILLWICEAFVLAIAIQLFDK